MTEAIPLDFFWWLWYNFLSVSFDFGGLMVLYFSATGNTEFIAEEIAKRTGDEALNLLENTDT